MLGEIRLLAGSRYPSFVYSSSPPAPSNRAVPVFMFHTIERDEFRAQLSFLARNGYRTPTLDEFYRFLVEGGALPPSSVDRKSVV